MSTKIQILLAFFGVAIAAFGIPAETQAGTPSFKFVNVSPALGISGGPYADSLGRGVSAADYDNDGFVDFFVANPEGVPDNLYHNLGNGQFEDVAEMVGLASISRNRCALWFDYDNDGDLDLLVANDSEVEPSGYRLYRQVSPVSFEDVTQAAGLFIPMPPRIEFINPAFRSGMSAGDFNNDGFLDFYAAAWNTISHLFLNNGDSTFTNLTATSNITNNVDYAHQGMWFDFNGDRLLDLYVSVDFSQNRLFINDGNGGFNNTGFVNGSGNSMNDMGLSLGDYDNDGDLDIYIANIFFDGPSIFTWNVMLRNDSSGANLLFNEVAQDIGVDNGGWAWGVTFLDADNDGHLDIASTNGWFETTDRSTFFWNQGTVPVAFANVSAEVAFNDNLWGSALVAFDYDRDGDLDLLQACMEGPIRLLQNQPATAAAAVNNNYLVIKPRMNGRNHFAIGTVVRIEIGSKTQMRLITAGTSYLGQEPAEAFFGIGLASTVDAVHVEWPDGRKTHLFDVEANQVLTVTDEITDAIPTVSHWGMTTLMLLTLIGASLLLRYKEQAASIREYRAG